MKSVLFVVSAARHWTLNDGTEHPTGFWAEELAVPHQLFSEAGWDITIATPGGVTPVVDELSLGIMGGLPSKRKEVRAYLNSIASELTNPKSLGSMNEADFDLVFYPGGHGPMEDLAYDPVSGVLLRRRLAAGRPLALLCHAPASIRAAAQPGGASPFTGLNMTALSNVEERFNPFGWKAPWTVEDLVRESGARYSKATLPFRPHVVVDRRLYTGQNPQSSEALAQRLLQDLN